MAGPGATEVGRVSVRVLPDTSGFRRELKAKLEGEESGLDIEIPLEVDATGLRQKIRAAVEAASAGIEAKIGVDVDYMRSAFGNAANALRDDIQVRPTFDQQEIRRIGQELGQQLNNGFNRNGGNGFGGGGRRGGGNLITRQISGILPNIIKLGDGIYRLFGQLFRNIRDLTRGVRGLNDALDDVDANVRRAGGADGAGRLRDNLNEASNAAGRLRNNVRDIGAENNVLDDLIDDLRRRFDNEDIRVRPRLDETALARFKREWADAMDIIRRPVGKGRLLEGEGEDIREISEFEAAVQRANRWVRDIARRMNDVTRASTVLRYVWNGLSSTVRGIPGWIRRITGGTEGVSGAWNRVLFAVNRARIGIESIARNGIDRVQNGVARSYLFLADSADRAFGRLRDGYDRVGIAANRFRIEVFNGANAMRGAYDSFGNALTRAAARVYDFRNNTLDLPARIYDARRAAILLGDGIRNARNYVTDLNRGWTDIQRATLIAGDRVREMGRRAIDVRSHFNSIGNAVRTVGNAIRNVDTDRIYRGFIRTGDEVVRFGRRGVNAVRGFGQGFRSIGTLARAGFSGIGALFSGIGDTATSAFTRIQSAVGGAVSGIGSLFSGMLGPIGQIAAAVLGLVTAFALLGAVSSIVAIAGAAITGAWASVAAIIAAIPAALFLIGGPLAAILIGMDGIKAAAETIAPQFEKLKKSISAVFEEGFKPGFAALKNIFPTLQGGLEDIAVAVSKVFTDLAKLVTTKDNLKLLEQTFNNIADSVTGLGTALQDIVQVLLDTGAMKGGFDALVGFVQEFAAQWRASIESLSQGGALSTLSVAFQGLETLLQSVARAFAGLVENGIRAFSTAAPGMTAGLDSLTNFFGRFDWERLGKAVGDVFEGLGETLDGIDASTIESLTTAFEGLGDTFRNADFQQMFRNVVDAIPGFISGMNDLIGVFARVASATVGFIQVMSGFFQTMKLLFTAFANPMSVLNGDFAKGFADATATATTGMQDIFDAFATGGTNLGTAAATAGQTSTDRLKQALSLGLNSTKDTARLGGDGVGAAITLGLQESTKNATAPLDALPGAVGTALAPVPGAVSTGLAGTNEAAAAALAPMGQVVQQAFAGLSVYGAMGVAQLASAVQSSMIAVDNAVRVGLVNLPVTVQTAFAGLSVLAAMGMAQIATAVSTGMLAVNAAMLNGIIGLGTSVSAGFIGVQTAATSGMTGLATIITAGFVSVQAAVTVGMQAIAVEIAAQVAAWAASLNLAFPAMTAAITVGVEQMRVAFSTGMQAISDEFTRFEQIITSIMQVMWPLMAEYVATGMAAVREAAWAELQGMSEDFTAAFQTMQTSVDTGMVNITTSFSIGMTQITEAVTTGMATAEAAISTGVANMVSTLQGGVAQFQAAGANMGNALAQGLESALPRVQAAAARLVAAAAAATAAAAQINSPSRVFIKLGEFTGAGYVNGIRNSIKSVVSVSRKMVNAAVVAAKTVQAAVDTSPIKFGFADEMAAEATRLADLAIAGDWETAVSSDGFGMSPDSIAGAVADGLAGSEFRFDADGIARIVNKSNTRKARRK